MLALIVWLALTNEREQIDIGHAFLREIIYVSAN